MYELGYLKHLAEINLRFYELFIPETYRDISRFSIRFDSLHLISIHEYTDTINIDNFSLPSLDMFDFTRNKSLNFFGVHSETSSNESYVKNILSLHALGRCSTTKMENLLFRVRVQVVYSFL